MPGTHRIVIFLFFAGLLLLPALPAQAIYLGNPVPQFEDGDFGVGLALTDTRETFFLDWAISEPGVLQLIFGNVDAGLGTDGTEFGIGYRHKIGKGFDMGKFPVNLGVVTQYRMGETEILGVTFEFSELNIGFGGAFTPVENLNVYAAAVYERNTVEVNVGIFGKVEKTDSGIGILIGSEYWITESFVAGLEIHPGLEDDDIAIFAEFKF